MKKLSLIISLILATVCAKAQQVDTIYLSTLTATHLLFEKEITYVDVVDPNVDVRFDENVNYILALQAKVPLTTSSSVSVITKKGILYTYIIEYDEHNGTLVKDNRITINMAGDVTRPEQELYHLGCGTDRVYGFCPNINVDGNDLVIVVAIENRSAIEYECEDAIFKIEPRRRPKRAAAYEQQLIPAKRQGSLVAAANGEAFAIYTFNKFTLAKDQILSIYLYEQNGARNITFSALPKDVNLAIPYKPKKERKIWKHSLQ